MKNDDVVGRLDGWMGVCKTQNIIIIIMVVSYTFTKIMFKTKRVSVFFLSE